MKRKKPLIGPKNLDILETMGNQIKLARCRRKMTCEMAAYKAGITRATLWKIERGDPSVAIGYYFKVLNILNLEKTMLEIAKDDPLGRLLQDAELDQKYKRTDRGQ